MRGIMLVDLTPDNLQLSKYPMFIELPNFLWTLLSNRAEAQKCDFGEVLQAVFMAGIKQQVTVLEIQNIIKPKETN